MLKKIFLVFVLGIVVLNSAYLCADELKEIELNDGNVIYGQIKSLNNGVYSVYSDTLGNLQIDSSKIKVIRSNPRKVSSGSETMSQSSVNAGIEAIKRALQSNASSMDTVDSLKNDEDFMAVLEDPVIMSAVEKGDVNILMHNEKFLKLLDNSSVKKIERDLD
ncbi:MAG: hypothetical protein HY810_02755 [Candidatus Omnitrophica bacterium]|nr:hypothetical protein [Candidatus Omnitrophota bacterium]